MKTLTLKVHIICTFIAVVAFLLGTVFLFLAQVENFLRFDLVPQMMETYLYFSGLALGTLAAGTGLVSIVLSLFRISEK